jgi:hypothetical protein
MDFKQGYVAKETINITLWSYERFSLWYYDD